ncbi:hypothetical protein HNP52_002856 [Sphingomonas kyeonggiensis]|uniref:Glycosyl transferase family 11 n=1 Tax=Sphingomonas kyeonggiensis TaxID=1268553 RepID=A0A7W7K2Z4_9SPHN|nr:hypothetical protein [Sphingomonas kyeonggiensis]MBB4839787.1 hypothetical protein [Sphingomonas kyeonggiensis]
MPVVVRTHGGLGNQLFQLLFARLFAAERGERLYQIHDLNYPHRFTQSDELPCEAPAGWVRALSAARLPKIAARLGAQQEWIALPGITLLDGYFQSSRDYARFSPQAVANALDDLRRDLAIPGEKLYPFGVHLRLGDFFADRTAAIAHVQARMAAIPRGAALLTNDEALLSSPELAPLLAEREAHVVTTAGMKSEDVLRTFCRFGAIDGNNSTLLFWASVLGDTDARFDDPRLAETQALLRGTLAREKA